MKPPSAILLAGLLVSCYEPFIPEVDTREKVLVVDGLITDAPAACHVKLGYASPYDSTGEQVAASQASVYVKDQSGNIFFFYEGDPGEYATDSTQFRGTIGSTYTLYITTRDGGKYVSDPQSLQSVTLTDSVYAGFEERESLDQITQLLNKTRGGAIKTDIFSEADTLPAMRFVTRVINQYWYNICPVMQKCYGFYCWQTADLESYINLTQSVNTTGSHRIRNHEISFVPADPGCFGLIYDYNDPGSDLPVEVIDTRRYQIFQIHTRILYVDRYILNQAAASFYKSMDAQLRSEGKLFDPIAVQLKGNMHCTSDPGQNVLGFFEASAITHHAYEVDFTSLVNGQPAIARVPCIPPPAADGCMINQVPSFWIP